MFSSEERLAISNWLIEHIESFEEVVGLLQVGSGARGYKDLYSDIDLVMVVDHPEDIALVNEKLLMFVKENENNAQVKIYEHDPEVTVSCVLLDNYLELDLGIWTLNKLKATKPEYKIIYDKTNQIEEKLTKSLPVIRGDEIIIAIDEHMSKLWQFVNNGFVAIMRNQLIQGFKELEVIKGYCLHLICLENKVYYDFYKYFDQLSDPSALSLKALYVCALSQDDLMKNLHDCVALYFEIVKRNSDQHQKAIDFIEGFLNRVAE